MATSDSVVSLPSLAEGVCVDVIHVKIERIVLKVIVRYQLGPMGPLQQLEHICMAVFDSSYKRRFLVVDDERVLARFSTLFAEGRCFKMSHFLVVRHGEGEAAKYYLKLQMTSIVERIVSYIPRYCFHLVSLPQVIAGYADGLGVFDISGFLVACYEPGLGQNPATVSMEVIIVLEDKSAAGQNVMLYCVLRGPCVDVALQLYEMLPNKNHAFVVLQYVHVKKCEKGGATIVSYQDGTKVHFNPVYPEAVHQKMLLAGRLTKPNAADVLPLL